MAQLNGVPLQTAATISQAIGINRALFVRLSNKLKQNKLVHVKHGRNGGHTLGRPASEISIYDVYLAIEGELQVSACLDGKESCAKGDKGHCRIREFFHELQEHTINLMKVQNIEGLDAGWEIPMPVLDSYDQISETPELVVLKRAIQIITTDRRKLIISIDEILLFEGSAGIIDIYTEQGVFEIHGKIAKVADCGAEFFSTHRFYTVNVNHVVGIDRVRREVLLSDGSAIPIVHYKVKAFLNHVATYRKRQKQLA